VSWNIDPFNDVASATSTRIDFSSAGETINGVPVQFVLHGSFQFNQEGDVTGGTITSMEKIDASGSSPIILETITVDGGLNVRDPAHAHRQG